MSFKLPAEAERFRGWLWILAGFMLAYTAQINYDTWLRFSPPKINVSYNDLIEPQPLSAPATRAASFGATEFAADLYWLKLIQYYGGGDPAGKYRKLADLFNTVTDLSPKFSAAYKTGLIILPGEGFADQALALGAKGKQNLPQDWEMPYYTGLVHHIYKKDYAAAAREFTSASELPGAPVNVKYFAALYYKEADQRKIAYELFRSIYETTEDEFIRDRSLKYVIHLEGIFTLEDAVNKFKSQTGRFPSSLAELVNQKIVPSLPVSPLGFNYSYDPASGKISESK